MKKILVSIGLVFVSCAHKTEKKSKGLLIYNAKIYTLNKSQPRAEAVVAKEGKIVFVGDTNKAQEHLSSSSGKNYRKIDFKGKALFPGFVDAHAHLAAIGYQDMELNLSEVKSVSQLKESIKNRAEKLGKDDWIQGGGWIETHWPEKRFPNKNDVDDVSGGRPLLISRADGHAALVNSKALELAGIDKNTPDPEGGKIKKDKQGNPTGLLIDHAIYLVQKLIPELSKKDLSRALVRGASLSAKKGWTGLHDTSGTWDEYQSISSLMKRKKIPIRIYKSITAPSKDADRLLREGPQKKFNGKLVMRSLKLFADGALGSRGAALLKPYNDERMHKGLLLIKDKEFLNLQKKAMESQIQIRTHAIGDHANRKVLDLFEEATADLDKEDRKNLRWRVEHAQVLHPKDLPRFSRLGLIASMQPSHAIGDLHFAADRVGSQRLKGAYAWRSLLDSGVIIAGGSDAPVEKGEPLVEFYAAVARKDLKGFSKKNWNLKERVTREQALKMFTIWAAYSAFEEQERGSVEVGKYADFTAFSGDLMKVPLKEIPKLKPILTVVEGGVVYEDL